MSVIPRYFVAIPLADEARARLASIALPLIPGMRVLGQEELHLTLNFVGQLSPEHVGVAAKVLGGLSECCFAITIRGVGRFPPEGDPRVLWAGVEDSYPLMALHESLNAALSDAIGFLPERRRYVPHVTLAHLNAGVPPSAIEQFVELNRGFHVRSVISQLCLYSSLLVDGRPNYREQAIVSLAAPNGLTTNHR